MRIPVTPLAPTFAARTPRLSEDQARAIIKERLESQNIPFSEIFPGVEGKKKTLDVFVPNQQTVAKAVASLRAFPLSKPHPDENKLYLANFQVGVWVNTQLELFGPR
jgi:hypothetical protein